MRKLLFYIAVLISVGVYAQTDSLVVKNDNGKMIQKEFDKSNLDTYKGKKEFNYTEIQVDQKPNFIQRIFKWLGRLFTRFLEWIFGVKYAQGIFASILPDDDKFLEYRLRMMHTLQSIVYAKTKFAMEANFGVYNQVTKSCLNDLSNAVGWTAMIGKHEIDPEYEAKRLLDFSAPFNEFYLKK